MRNLKVLISNGYMPDEFDRCVYNKFHGGIVLCICSYVDDMLIISTSLDTVNLLKRFLMSTFDNKDVGEVNMIIGFRVAKDHEVLFCHNLTMLKTF